MKLVEVLKKLVWSRTMQKKFSVMQFSFQKCGKFSPEKHCFDLFFFFVALTHMHN
jgi:hypothetical protein